jgi:hypothetical protein
VPRLWFCSRGAPGYSSSAQGGSDAVDLRWLKPVWISSGNHLLVRVRTKPSGEVKDNEVPRTHRSAVPWPLSWGPLVTSGFTGTDMLMGWGTVGPAIHRHILGRPEILDWEKP